ncbi:N(4)-(Beta-N-acetylglucosaminyl)-L-asparaginase-like [Homarus americanus]|uniref:N(4)-(beta-N-acetylglucosaminyl)-L-asparaginase n=1 Tax=Homarus americanus TaxID=6706 RepID=A0A8J5J5V7_HOMAM|nr:N(4)-(Beta-N-acetylglucosaminyl)-L-asparaginase-like [Homarus americanus]KAG7153285.1 N(4)-(Beta-N-acetylglucosaminyl)-L-asparaginase-like [Homarus americanus]
MDHTAGCLQCLVILLTTVLLGEGFSPIAVNTWNFTNATEKAWSVLSEGGSALDAVEKGCTICEELQCDGTVGFGGSPDENGETTLDAMIMDGTTHDVGAVGALRRVKDAISVARKVMEHTSHTLLVGDQATEFALMMGFKEYNLTTDSSAKKFESWKNSSCQPNYWRNVLPDPKTSCGPYLPVETKMKHYKWFTAKEGKNFNVKNHDTIGMITIDKSGHIAGGTSTNGAIHKVPGRVGDSPIPGSGVYVDKHIGGAAATGDGDVMMRFMPALLAVELMRNGLAPDKAAETALRQIASYYSNFMGAVVAVTISGEYGAACHGFDKFPYSVVNSELKTVTVMNVPCFA